MDNTNTPMPGASVNNPGTGQNTNMTTVQNQNMASYDDDTAPSTGNGSTGGYVPPQQPNGMADYTAAAINLADGQLELSQKHIVEGDLVGATGDVIATRTYREENDVHDGIMKIETTAKWMMLATCNYNQAKEARDWNTFIENDGVAVLKSHGLLSSNAEQNFYKDTGILTATGLKSLTDQQFDAIAKDGFFRTAPVKFSSDDLTKLNDLMKDTDANEVQIRSLFTSMGIDMQKKSIYQIAHEANTTGEVVTTYSFTREQRVSARVVVDQRNLNSKVLNPTTQKERAQSMQYLRREAIKNVGIDGFVASKSQLKQLETLHREPVRDPKTNNIVYNSKNEPQMREFYAFKDKKGRLIEVDAAKRDLIKSYESVLGHSYEDTAAQRERSHRLNELPTVIMDSNTKTGYRFTKVTGRTAARTASVARRGTIAIYDNAKVFAHTVANASTTVAQGAAFLGNKMHIVNDEKYSGMKGALDKAKNGIKTSKEIAIGDKATRKDIFKKEDSLRRAKRGRNSKEIEAARNQLNEAKGARRAEMRDRRDARYAQKHHGKNNRYNRLQKRIDRKTNRLKRRERFRRTRAGKVVGYFEKSFGYLFKGTRGVAKKAFSGVAAIGKLISNSPPMKLLASVFNAFAEVKRAIIRFLGKVGLSVCGIYLVAALVLVLIGNVYNFFSLFDTNYEQALFNDIETLETEFLNMAKSDGGLYYQDLITNANNIIENQKYQWSSQYEKLMEVTNPRFSTAEKPVYVEVSKTANIGKYYRSLTKENENHVSTDTLGSLVPYFGIMRYRYPTDMGADYYGIAMAQIYNLWIKAHRIDAGFTNRSYHLWKNDDMTGGNLSSGKYGKTINYCSASVVKSKACTNAFYHTQDEKTGKLLPIVSSVDGNTYECDNETITYEAGKKNCTHTCWEPTVFQGVLYTSSCYSGEVVTYTCSESDPGYYNHVDYYRWNAETHEIEYGNFYSHVHNNKCGCKLDTSNMKHNCSHVCSKWVSPENHGCYETKETHTCNGHCAGHAIPEVDIYYTDSIAGIASLDRDPDYAKDRNGQMNATSVFASLHASALLDKQEMQDIMYKGAYGLIHSPDIPALSSAKRYDTGGKSWVGTWNKYVDAFNAEWPKDRAPTSANFKNGGKYTDDYFISNDNPFRIAADFFFKDDYNKYFLWSEFTESFLALNDNDIEYIRSMVGDYDTGYKEGIEMWKSFGVTFPDEGFSATDGESIDAVRKNIEARYGNNTLYRDNPTAKTVVEAALNYAGIVTYDASKKNASVDFVNVVLTGINGGNYKDFAWYEKKATTTNQLISFSGAQNLYFALAPGAILVAPSTKEVAIYLGQVGDESYQIINCSSQNWNSKIYTIGWEQLDRKYTKTINTDDLAKINWSKK